MDNYLASSDFIDWKTEIVFNKARELAAALENELEIAQACFEFVRDEIQHSLDYKRNPVTCKASEVITHQTGYCFAKSHLLAALLRANRIPAALCYQRIAFGENQSSFYLHGFNAIYLNGFGWYRVDPRGNKAGMNAQFTPPLEALLFTPQFEGELIYAQRWIEPSPAIISLLKSSKDYLSVMERLPSVNLSSKESFKPFQNPQY